MFTTEIQNINGHDFLVIRIPRIFSEDAAAEILNEIKFGLRRAHSSHKTLLTLIDFDFTLRHISSTAILYNQLGFLTEIPRVKPGFRIAIIADEDSQETVKRLDSFFDVPNTPSGWFDKALTVIDMAMAYGNAKENPTLADPWISVQPSQEAAVLWCLDSATWT